MKMTAMEIMTGTEDAAIARRERRKTLLRSALIILAIAILATLPGWFPGMIYGGAGPRSAMSRMAVEYAAQRLKAGEIPLWNPNVGLGEPVIGNGATAVFFPTILLHMVLPAKWAEVVSAVVMMWLAGFGMVMLVAGFASRTGSQSEPYSAGSIIQPHTTLFACVIFMLAIVCLEFLHLSSMNALAVLPWAMLASGTLLSRITAARLVGITLLFLIIFLSGDNAASVGVVLACLIFLIWNISRGPRRWAGFVGALLVLLSAVGVAATLAAVQWMPAHYNSGIEGINGFAFATRSGASAFVLLPVVILGLVLASGWVVGQSKGLTRSLLLGGWPVVLLGFAAFFSAGALPKKELVETAKRAEGQGESGQFRAIAEGNDSWQMSNNALATALGTPKRMSEWLKSVGQIQHNEIWLARVDHPALRLLGAKYLISDRRMEPTTRPATATAPGPTRRLFGRQPVATPMGRMEWKPVWPTTRPSGGVVVYENVAQPLPRFWIARNAQWADKAQEIFDRLKNTSEQADFDPHDVVLLDREGEAESEYGMLRRPPPAVGRGSLQLLEDSPERVRIATEGAGGWLVLADAYAPGWRAKMSYTVSARGPRRGRVERTYERELGIVPAYGAMRAVALAGGAEIVFEYEPKGWKNGLMVAGIGAIVLLLMVGGMMFPASEGSGFRMRGQV